MLVKVCGMRDRQNVDSIAKLPISMMGFIFYNRSSRFVKANAPQTPKGIERVGVFVNADISEISEIVKRNNLTYVQLHGEESVEVCRRVKELQVKVIKAISIATPNDFSLANTYQGEVDLLLFDTKCVGYGGSGRSFDWSMLDNYRGETPFLLSGGIDLDMVDDIKQIKHPKFAGVDINSKFELSAAVKSVDKVEKFIKMNRKDIIMNRIDKLFADKQDGILSVYYPAGFPALDDTCKILAELQDAGVDMVELGIPFSDPMADGVVIQDASGRALKNGMSLKLLFSQISSMRDNIALPVILMGYLNPILSFGFENFCRECAKVGVDGVIIPDLPFNEYMNEYKAVAEKYDIKVVMFISPETSKERVELIDQHSSGFIYMVSAAGTTGVRGDFDTATTDYFARINSMNLSHPRLIGFGISNKTTYKMACSASRGAIIGSHFVKLLDKYSSPKEAVKQLIKDLK